MSGCSQQCSRSLVHVAQASLPHQGKPRKSWHCRPTIPLPTPALLGLQVGREGADTRVQNRVRLRRESLLVEHWGLALGQMQELSLSSGLAKKPALCLVCGGRDEDKGGRGEDGEPGARVEEAGVRIGEAWVRIGSQR